MDLQRSDHTCGPGHTPKPAEGSAILRQEGAGCQGSLASFGRIAGPKDKDFLVCWEGGQSPA